MTIPLASMTAIGFRHSSALYEIDCLTDIEEVGGSVTLFKPGQQVYYAGT